MNLFLCDIEGTYKGSKNREEQLNRLINNLNKINEIDNSNMIFSFISDSEFEDVKKCIKELKKYLSNDITLGFQYANRYKFNDLE